MIWEKGKELIATMRYTASKEDYGKSGDIALRWIIEFKGSFGITQ